MYQPRPSPRDRAVTLALVVAIHVALGFALINLSGNVREALPQDVVEMFDVTIPPPPPPPVVEKLPEPDKAKPKQDEGAASAKNIKSKATPVVAPKLPIALPIALPIPQPMPATTTTSTGSDSTQGASTPGTGTGAGGQGRGTGSGGSGSGSGGGGSGGIGTRPRLASPSLGGRDYPGDLRRVWPRSARVAVAVRVQLDGRGTDCKINLSSGVAAIDAETCRLVESRLRFRPATDESGRPVVAWAGYIQLPVNF